MSLKALARAVLLRNRDGNSTEIKSFLSPLTGATVLPPKETEKYADEFTPAERSLWCLDHELTKPNSRCPYKKSLIGCTLWEHINHKKKLRTVGGSK